MHMVDEEFDETLDQIDQADFRKFDHLAETAQLALKCTGSLISVRKDSYLYIVGKSGLPEDASGQVRLPTNKAVCQFTLALGSPIIVSDTRSPRLPAEVTVIDEFSIGSYIGMPLTLSGQRSVGSFCAISHEPREWTDLEARILESLAAHASLLLDLAVQENETHALSAQLTRNDQILMAIAKTPDAAIVVRDMDGHVVFANDGASAALALDRTALYTSASEDLTHPHDRERVMMYSNDPANGSTGQTITIRMKHAVKGWIWVRANFTRTGENLVTSVFQPLPKDEVTRIY